MVKGVFLICTIIGRCPPVKKILLANLICLSGNLLFVNFFWCSCADKFVEEYDKELKTLFFFLIGEYWNSLF
jgi:hypothetical protein